MKTLTFLFLILLTGLTFAQNNALNFGGTNQYVSIGSVFSLDGYSESVEAWVNLSTTSENGFFVHVGDNNTGYGIGVGSGSVDVSGNELIVLIDTKRWVTTTTNIGTGWHHVAMTIDASGNVIIYLDGVAVKTETGNTTVPVAPTGSSSLGSAQTTTRILSSGIIDEVRIWNDVRTSTEINNNMSIELSNVSGELNLVAYYKLNEASGTTASDSKGSNNGTLNNMLDANWVSAQNNALNFGGTNQYVSISSVFALDGYSESVEAWVNLSTTSENGFFVHVGDNNTGYGIGVGSGSVDVSGNELIVLIDTKRWVTTTTNIGTGWHHVAMTIDASGNVIIYLDGVAVKTETGNTTVPVAPTGSSSLGTAQTTTRILSSGIIDEVRIWNDVRTSTEINNNMSKELPNVSGELNLVAYYKLNETSGTTAYDSKGSNNGTLNNMLDANWVTSTALSLTVQSTYYMAKTTGNWSAFGTVWFTNTTGGTIAGNYTTQATAAPTASNSAGIIINTNVTVDASVSIDQCTVNSGTTLTVGIGVVLTVSNGTGTDLTITGAIVNSGTVTINSGTLVNYNGGSQTVLALNYSMLSFTGSTSGSTKTFADGTTKIGSEITLADAITVTGSSASAVTVQVTTPGAGGTSSRVFNVDASGKTVNISNITIKGGDISGAPSAATYGGGIYINAGTLNLDNAKVDGSTAAWGGGIFNNSTVNITNCTISNNTVGSSRYGGGIYNNTGKIMSIISSTISNNSGEYGGGITNIGALTITNSTISANTASTSGGGIYNGGTLTITNSTLFNNSTVSNGAGLYSDFFSATTILNTTISKNNVSGSGTYEDGGGVYLNDRATIDIKNTIIAGNTSTVLTNDDYYYYYDTNIGSGGTLTDNGYNVVEYQAGGSTGAGKTFTATTNILYNTKADGTTSYTSWNSNNVDLANQNLNLSITLANNNTTNGTQTLALSSGSFVIDAGTDTGAPTTDQRGAARSGTTDIGSYEYNGSGGALPVELTLFTARIVDEAVELNWQTATEINNYGFEVERASFREDGTTPVRTDWETLGFVEGHGNSNSPKHYEFLDETPLADSAEYRLKQIDTDGAYTYYAQTVKVSGFGVTDVEDIDIPKEYVLEQNYPNPFNPSTTINYGLKTDSDIQLTVYNILGQEVATLVNQKQQAGSYSVNFDASNLASGTYIYRIISGDFISVKKFILMK